MDPLLPSELNTSAQGFGLEVSPTKRAIRYIGDGRHSSDVGAMMGNRPIPTNRAYYYFEIHVIDGGESSRIGIGFADKNFKLTRQPGWDPMSFGYHGDDGRKYNAQPKGEDYGPPFSTGDTVGACIHMAKQEVFFTKNGARLKTAFYNVKGTLFPVVALHSKNEHVEINFGQKPFMFDVEGMLIEDKAAQRAALDRIPVPASLSHKIVRRYLQHFGYAETLRAFDEAAGTGIEDDDGDSMAVDDDGTALAVRHAARCAVLRGDVDAALEAVGQAFPQVLADGSGYEEVQLALQCQKFIEIVRSGRIEESVTFAQTVLAGMRRPGGPTNVESVLREVVAIIAYEKPETSPLAHLLSVAQRERVADAVNAAVLCAASSSAPRSVPQSNVERLLQHVVAVHQVLLEQNSNMGEPFCLAGHLPLLQPSASGGSWTGLPPPTAEGGVAQQGAGRAAHSAPAGMAGVAYQQVAAAGPPDAGLRTG